MKCPSCGNDIPSSAEFRPECGMSISQRLVEELSDAIEVPDSCTESVIAPNGKMSNLNIASVGISQNNEKNFEREDRIKASLPVTSAFLCTVCLREKTETNIPVTRYYAPFIPCR